MDKKKCAEALKLCGYADHFGHTKSASNEIIGWFVSWQPDPYKTEPVDPENNWDQLIALADYYDVVSKYEKSTRGDEI